MARLHRPGHLPIGICLTDGAAESIFLHQTANLLDVHDDRRIKMQHAHVDAPCSLLVSPKFISLLHQGKIRAIRFLTALPQRRGIQPGVISGPGYACDPTQSTDVQQIAVLPYSLADEAVLSNAA